MAPGTDDAARPTDAARHDQLFAQLLDQVRTWIEDDPDPRTAAELTTLLRAAEAGDAGARDDLRDRFSGVLQFGTAGLRGALGGGPARMNRAVVARAAAGLGAFLAEELSGRGASERPAPRVVIGFDARYGSEEFARDSAQILAGAGAEVALFDQYCPTPVLAYAVRELGADAGVMVTASHNPPEDNGYKVYLGGRIEPEDGNGVQIVAPADAQIAAHIAAVSSVAGLPRSQEFTTIGDELIGRYINEVLTLARPHPDTGQPGEANPGEANPKPDLKIVYTPLHGVGGEILARVLTGAGFTELTPVPAQVNPDPNFPTVAFPNPEEAGALDLAYEAAGSAGADLIIANDPDADRVSIAVPTGEGPNGPGWRQLTGDEVGALLGESIAAGLSAPGRAVFANSIVSSRLLGAIAAHYGIAHHETLTGFKWIARAPGISYGYEEAIGYCVHPEAVRDKDGISAALVIALLAARTARAGRALPDLLDDLAVRHGLYASGALSVRLEDLSEIPAAMARLRSSGPPTLAGSPVIETDDLSTPGAGLPATDALVYLTRANDRVIVRPSGTEPKVKCYLEVVIDVADRDDLTRARAEAAARLELLTADIAAAAGLD